MKIGFIGGGNMASAIIGGMVEKKVYAPEQIMASGKDAASLENLHNKYGIVVTEDNARVMENSEVVFLSVKPQILPMVIAEIAPLVKENQLFISIAAGKNIEWIENEFGKEIISTDGSLNRRALAKIVFTGEGADERLKKLNKIAHKFILDETRRRLEGYKSLGYKAAIVDAPVLFESEFDKECDIIISVIANKEVRIGRIMERDNIDRDSAEARIASQMSNDELISRSNFVIENNSDLSTLEKRVNEVAELILNN